MINMNKIFIFINFYFKSLILIWKLSMAKAFIASFIKLLFHFTFIVLILDYQNPFYNLLNKYYRRVKIIS